MKFIAALLVLCFALAVSAQQGTNWAVLVAGSNGYYNYRFELVYIFLRNKTNFFVDISQIFATLIKS